MKHALRIVVAIVFIASGFVKAVDPVGFSFKLEEYFSPAVFNLGFLVALALPFSILVIALELILGFLLLLNIALKFTLRALISLCIFFAFLTFYSAYYNVVTDCGCFGDAIKFTPWQSFTKDVVLLVLLLLLYKLYRKDFVRTPNFKMLFVKSFVVFGQFLVSGLFMFKGISSEPLIDFRDYKIGADLNLERKKIEANPAKYRVIYALTNKATGEKLRVNQDDYINKNFWKDKNWQIIKGQEDTELVSKGYESSVNKFDLESNGRNITSEILTAPRAVLLCSYHPDKVTATEISWYEKMLKREKGAVYGVSTKKNTFKTVPEATMDGIAIKTIARSNPFILILQHGKIVAKLPAQDYFNKSKI